MTRRHDWADRLFKYVDSRRETPFAWGTHDCCRFAAGAVLAMTDKDYMASFDYSSELGAAKLIRKAGSLDALVHRALGDPLPAVAYAQRGDVVIADLDNGPTVGVVVGLLSAYAAAAGGLLFLPTEEARMAWRIS